MKKRAVILLLLSIMLILTACGKVSVEPVPAPAGSEPSQARMTAEDIINTVLVDGAMLYEETIDDLKANSGRNIGTDYDKRNVVDEGVKFMAADGENPFMPLAKRLDEVEGGVGGSGGNQAFYIKFKPSGKDFGLMLSASASVGLTIGENNEPCVFIMDHNYMEPLDTSLRIEPGNWYHALLAMGSDGLLQGAIWKDGAEDQAAYINIAIRALHDDRYANQSWQVNIGFQGEATFTVADYAYYTFSNFVQPDRVPEIAQNEPQIDYNDPMSMASSILNDARVLGGENTEAMADNMGGQFGFIDTKKLSDDGSFFQLGSGSDGAWMQLNTRLADLGNRDNAQAVMIKFQPNDTEGLSFHLIGNGEVVLSFEDNMPYFTHVNDNYKAPYSDYMQTGISLQPDKWYWALMAFDSHGYYRSLVWEDGNGRNCAYCGENMGDWHGDYKDSNWKFVTGFGANQTLNVQEYQIMDFDDLVEGDIWSTGGSDAQNAADNENPTISSFDFDQEGNYGDLDAGFAMKINSTAWNGADKDSIHCTFSIHNVPVEVDILFPENQYDIKLEDGYSYRYNPPQFQLADPPADIDTKIAEVFGDDAQTVSDEIVMYIDDYCHGHFGYYPRELIMMNYE